MLIDNLIKDGKKLIDYFTLLDNIGIIKIVDRYLRLKKKV